MIIDPSRDDVSAKGRLPAVSVDSMTQVQLEELVPKLVIFSTGKSQEVLQKPKWWTDNIPWRGSDFDKVIIKDEIGIDVLRELIRGCYKYLGQEDLLMCPDLPSEMKPLPSSPQLADAHLKAAEPSSAVNEDFADGLQKSIYKENEGKEGLAAQTYDKINQQIELSNGALSKGSHEIVVNLGIIKEIADEDILVSDNISEASHKTCPKAEIKNTSNEQAGEKSSANHVIDTVEIASNRNREGDEMYTNQDAESGEIPYNEIIDSKDLSVSHTIEAGGLSSYTTEKNHKVTEEAPSDDKEAKFEKQEDDVVWICFICAREFPNQTELMTHQDSCEDSSEDHYIPMEAEATDIPDGNIIDFQGNFGLKPDFFETPVGLTTNAPCSFNTMPSKSPVMQEQPISLSSTNDACLSTSLPVLTAQLKAPLLARDITGAPTLPQAPVSVNNPVPTLLTKVGSQFKSLPLGLPLVRKRKRKRVPDIYVPPPPDIYFNSLGLGLTPKVREIEETPKKSDRDCDIIDLTLEESHPVTPRTLRSLISQWSREEASGRRRQLSFTQHSQHDKEKEEESSSDSDSSENSQDDVKRKRNVPCKSTIYAIPLTSPLGQRLKKNWQNENHVPVVSDIEQFCKTSNDSFKSSSVGSDVMDKLRHRPPPQVTFRFTKKYLNKYYHSYKFNSADKREFQKKLKTGLDKDSRKLLKLIRPCKVVLSRISKKDIKYWTTRGQKIRNNYMDQLQQHLKQRILLEQQKVFRARYQQAGTVNSQRFILHNNSQFQNQSPGIPRQTFPTRLHFVGSRPQGPTPQLLVRHGAGLKPILPASNLQPSQSVSAVKRELTGSQKRKQDFSDVRVDDEISIISLSSDEEEENDGDRSKECHCIGCQRKEKCAIQQKPRIGPASFKQREALKQQQCIYSRGASQFSREKIPVSAQKDRFSALVNTGSAIGRFSQGGSAVCSAKPEFMNFRMVNGQIQNLRPSTTKGPVVHQNATPHSPLILNKSIIKRPYIMPQPGTVSSAPGSPTKGPCSPIKTAPSSPVKGPCSPIKMGTGAHVHKDEALGFEVIMIDSDDDD